jgi:hypothetical protein
MRKGALASSSCTGRTMVADEKKGTTNGSGEENDAPEEKDLPEPEPPPKYPADWRKLFVDALPLLEWVAARGSAAGSERQDLARRLIVRHYIAATRSPETAEEDRPGLVKVRVTIAVPSREGTGDE